MSGQAIQACIVTGIIIGVAAYGWGPVSPALVLRWSVRFGVLVTSTDVPLVARRLRRARGIRWSAAATGIAVASLPTYMNVIDESRAAATATPLNMLAPALLAAIGAILAELTVVQRPAARTSDLRRRRVVHYVPAIWLRTIIGFLALGTIGAIATPGDRAVTAAAVCSAFVVAALAALGLRALVDRPLTSAEDRSIDDAFRADGAHHIVGPTVAVTGSAAAFALTDVFAVTAWSLMIGLLATVPLWCWYWIAVTDRWNVARAQLNTA